MYELSPLGYLKPSPHIAQNHICVLPCGGVNSASISEWNSANLEYYVNYHVDGKPVDRLFNGFVFNGLSARNNRYMYPLYAGFTQPANRQDWENWLDSLFAPEKNLNALFMLALNSPLDVWVSVPYPFIGQNDFGEIDGRVLNFEILEDRFTAVAWWIGRFLERWLQEPRLAERLRFRGFLWQRSSIHNYDESLVSMTTQHIRERGLLSLWLPYYGSYGSMNWKGFNFDLTAFHTNYYGNTPYSCEWIKITAINARYYNTGMQIVFGKGMFYNDTHFLDYFNLGLQEYEGYMTESFIVYKFPNQTLRGIYEQQFIDYARLYLFVKGFHCKTPYVGIPYA